MGERRFNMPMPEHHDEAPETKRMDVDEAPPTVRGEIPSDLLAESRPEQSGVREKAAAPEKDEWDEKTGVMNEGAINELAEKTMKDAALDESAPETRRGGEGPMGASQEVGTRFYQSVVEGKPMSSSEMIDDVTFWLSERPTMRFSTVEVLGDLRNKLGKEAADMRRMGNNEWADVYEERMSDLAAAIEVAKDKLKDKPVGMEIDTE